MADAGDLGALPADDRILQEWLKVRSILHESEHRFNARYFQQEYCGAKADPQETLKYLIGMHERAVAIAVKTVTDHTSRPSLGARNSITS